jgi:hypothetical protein
MKLTEAGGGGTCQDGDTCPAKFRTGQGVTVFVGRPVTDPDTLAQLAGRVGPGEQAFEVPDEIADL